MSDQAAIEVLRQLVSRAPAGAQPPVAWKVALNVAAFQKRLGLTRPLAAPISRLENHASGETLGGSSLRELHVEAEIAICLANDLREPATHEQLHASIESYAPCLELVDYALPRTGLPSLFEHRFFHAGVVLGASVTRDAYRALPDEFPRASDALSRVYGRVADTVPGDLIEALRGVLERALEAGTQLYRGQLVLCGSYIDPVPLPPGAHVRVDYGPRHSALEIARSPS